VLLASLSLAVGSWRREERRREGTKVRTTDLSLIDARNEAECRGRRREASEWIISMMDSCEGDAYDGRLNDAERWCRTSGRGVERRECRGRHLFLPLAPSSRST